MIRKYHNHKLQTNPWHPEEVPHNHHETPGRQTKQSKQLSLLHQNDCRTITDSHNGSNNKQKVNNRTTATTALERTAALAAGVGGGGGGGLHGSLQTNAMYRHGEHSNQINTLSSGLLRGNRALCKKRVQTLIRL